jgi:hypothetical protein
MIKLVPEKSRLVLAAILTGGRTLDFLTQWQDQKNVLRGVFLFLMQLFYLFKQDFAIMTSTTGKQVSMVQVGDGIVYTSPNS